MKKEAKGGMNRGMMGCIRLGEILLVEMLRVTERYAEDAKGMQIARIDIAMIEAMRGL